MEEKYTLEEVFEKYTPEEYSLKYSKWAIKTLTKDLFNNIKDVKLGDIIDIMEKVL